MAKIPEEAPVEIPEPKTVTFTNVSGVDLEVRIDGTGHHVPAGESFDVPGLHADRLRLQPHFKEQKTSKGGDN